MIPFLPLAGNKHPKCLGKLGKCFIFVGDNTTFMYIYINTDTKEGEIFTTLEGVARHADLSSITIKRHNYFYFKPPITICRASITKRRATGNAGILSPNKY